MVDLEFIKRCMTDPNIKKEAERIRIEGYRKSNKWQRDNPNLQRECVKKYEKTEKGQIARKKATEMRLKRVKDQTSLLSDHDKHLIRQFYVNCPEGYHVDHILPLSLGGSHHISNLQYLKPQDNLKKGYKLLIEIMNCPKCNSLLTILNEEYQYCETCNKAFGIYEYENLP